MIYIIKTSILSFITILNYLIVYQAFAISAKNTFIHITTLIDWICDVFMSTFGPRFILECIAVPTIKAPSMVIVSKGKRLYKGKKK